MIKVDIHRSPTAPEQDHTWLCETALVAVLDKDGSGRPKGVQTRIAGKFTAPDILIMTRILVEQVEEIMRAQFGAGDDFDILEFLEGQMGRTDMLSGIPLDTSRPN